MNRYESPGTGRFLTPDPYSSPSSSDPGSWNKYAYTRGDPVNRVDPAGADDDGDDPDCEALACQLINTAGPDANGDTGGFDNSCLSGILDADDFENPIAAADTCGAEGYEDDGPTDPTPSAPSPTDSSQTDPASSLPVSAPPSAPPLGGSGSCFVDTNGAYTCPADPPQKPLSPVIIFGGPPITLPCKTPCFSAPPPPPPPATRPPAVTCLFAGGVANENSWLWGGKPPSPSDPSNHGGGTGPITLPDPNSDKGWGPVGSDSPGTDGALLFLQWFLDALRCRLMNSGK